MAMVCVEPDCSLADQVEETREAFWKGSEADFEGGLERLADTVQEHEEHIKQVGIGRDVQKTVRTLDDLIESTANIRESICSLRDKIRNNGKDRTARKLDEVARHVHSAEHHLMVARASVLNKERRYAESEEGLAEALVIEITPEAANELGAAFTGMGRYDEAESCLKTAMLLRPGYSAAEFNKAVLDDDTGNHGLAADGFDFLLRSGDLDRFDLLVRKGLALARDGRHEGAVDCFDEAAVMRPDSSDVQYHKADSLYRLGMYDESAACYDRAHDLGGPADAGARRERMLQMRNRVPGRVWLPAMAAGMPGGFAMPEIQYALYIAQEDTGAAEYDFGSLGFGPYSEDLMLDISYNTGIFRVGVDVDDPCGIARICRLAPTGAGRAGRTGGKAVSVSLGRSSAMPPAGLLDAAYSTFTTRPSARSVRSDLEGIASAGSGENASSVSIAAAGTASHALSLIDKLGTARDTVQGRAILNISGMMVHVHGRMLASAGPPVDHYAFDSATSDLRGYGRLLLEYSREHAIMKYPAVADCDALASIA